VTQDQATPENQDPRSPYQRIIAASHYGLLGLPPSASVREIRQAYRDLSKLYHPDTTTLAAELATAKFQQLNEAYATLSNPERRLAYDQKIGYSRVAVVQPLPSLNHPLTKSRFPEYSSSAYLDPTDRPLSAGEIFALFILGVTFLVCLILAITIGITRSEVALKSAAQKPPVPQVIPTHQPSSASAIAPVTEPKLTEPKLIAPKLTEPKLTEPKLRDVQLSRTTLTLNPSSRAGEGL
jgi:hypothetical protein